MILPTDTMTATERFEAILNRSELPDRIPIHLMGVPEYSVTRIEFGQQESVLADEDPFFADDRNILFTPLGDKTLGYYFGGEDCTYSAGLFHDFEMILDEQGRIITDTDKAARYKARDEGQFVNYKGRRNGWKKLDTGHRYTWFIDGFLKKKEQIEVWYSEHGWPHEHKIAPVDRAAVHEFQAHFGDRMFLCGHINRAGLFEETWFMMGMDSFGYLCARDAPFIDKIVDSILQQDINAVEALKPLHFSCIYLSDDLGQKGRPLISPRTFKRFFFEPYKELFGAIHDIGARVIMHSCGNIVELLPLLVDAGLDGWQSMEVPAEIDHAAVKKQFGDKLVLVGGIDSSRELTFGTPASIEQHVRAQIKAMGKGGGYISGPAHDYLKVPLKNAIAMRDAVHKWGRY
nr:uroporphyrinogen decarboxylase family protein [Candidatus Sigynarchaeum springense]